MDIYEKYVKERNDAWAEVNHQVASGDTPEYRAAWKRWEDAVDTLRVLRLLRAAARAGLLTPDDGDREDSPGSPR